MELTKNQKLAVNATKGNYLVSASAGSGKTSVLTQRVFKVLLDGTKLDELLILTFTNLAAAEMRDRIRDELIKLGDEKSLKIAANLEAAAIETYDAYALNIVKKYYYVLGLNKDISIVDQTLLELEERKIIEQIFNEHFDQKDEKVLNLIDQYCLRNSDNLKQFIIDIRNKFDLKEDKEEYMSSYISAYFNKEKVIKDVNDYLEQIRNNIYSYIAKVKQFENIDYVDAFLPILERYASFKDYDDLLQLLNNEEISFPRAAGKLSLNEYPDDALFHKYYTKQIGNIKKQLLFSSLDELINQYLGNKENTETLLLLVKELDERLFIFKRKHNVYSFSDIFKFALKIVSIPEINKELKNKYKYIMIDEYQDTSDIQEKFINKIANDNVYVVGDVKQSIYRFRNANCDLFLDKFNRYGLSKGGTRIELPENFRSRKEVVDAVNKIFSPIMTSVDTGLDYKREHLMIHGNKSYLPSSSNYEAEILEYELGEKYLIAEHEARLIATDIATKMKNKYQVYDKNTKSLRDVKYSDFAVIMYAKSDFSLYQKVFNEYQIPLFANYDKSIRENNLTMTFENIINLLYLYSQNDFSKAFRHSFISVMRSFLFSCSSKDVEDIIYVTNYQKYPLYSLIENIANETKESSLKEKIISIIKNFSFYEKLITIGDVSTNISLLEYYYQIAAQMDEMGYSLSDLKKYFDDLKEFEIDPEYSPSDNVKDCVKLLSIHASKGLQFKICYFAELYKRFNNTSSTGHLLIDSIYGIDIANVKHKQISTFYHKLIASKEKKEQLLEQLRVFYVALTRAEEKIILLANVDDRKNPIQEFAQSNHYLDFVSLANKPFTTYSLNIERIKNDVDELNSEASDIIVQPEISLSDERIINRHASKELDNDVDNELLLLGNKYHYYLELVDFNTLDTSFIKDEKDKKRLDRFLNNDLFKNMKDANIMHEYPFYDEEENVNGVIDLLVEHVNHIDIIDFKLSHVDDLAYEKQLGTYKKYIAKLTNKKINTYVTGILSGDIKKID